MLRITAKANLTFALFLRVFVSLWLNFVSIYNTDLLIYDVEALWNG